MRVNLKLTMGQAGISRAFAVCVAIATAMLVVRSADAAEAKLPQLDIATYPSQIFWLIVSFVILYFLVARVAAPRIARVLEERQDRIADDLDEAETLKREAEEVRAEYEKALSDARGEAHKATRDAQDSIVKTNAAGEAAAQEKITAILKEAEGRIGASRTEALSNVRAVAQEVAGDAVGKLIGVTVPQESVERAIDAAMKGRG